MARREEPKSDARERTKEEALRSEKGRVLGEAMYPSPAAKRPVSAVSFPVGGPRAKLRRRCYVERFIGLQSRPWCKCKFC